MKNSSNISKELLEIIERFINGSMSTQELKDFNQLLELDNDFKTTVEDVKTMLKIKDQQTSKKQTKGFYKEIPKHPVEDKLYKKNKYSILSIITGTAAIFIVVGSIMFFSSPENSKLYAKYFKIYPGLPTSNKDNFIFNDAMVQYKRGNYNMAIEKWKILVEEQPENDTLNFFLGVAHLANKNVPDAIPYLEHSIEAEDDFTFLNNAYLYLGLAYLKEGHTELAKKNFSFSNTNTGKKLILIFAD